MANILCIETATTNCSVALSVNGSVIALREDNNKGYSHAEQLHIFIKEVLAEATMQQQELDAVAVSKGPGSYTGLRIGVSATKGLCFALDIPLISVPTLQVLAEKVTENTFVVPMLDARRMEVYSMVYDSFKQEIRGTEAQVLDDTSFVTYLSEHKVTFIGDGVSKFQEICMHPNAVFRADEFPSAVQMASIAEKKYQVSDTEDVAYFEPYYLKDFIAGKKQS